MEDSQHILRHPVLRCALGALLVAVGLLVHALSSGPLAWWVLWVPVAGIVHLVQGLFGLRSTARGARRVAIAHAAFGLTLCATLLTSGGPLGLEDHRALGFPLGTVVLLAGFWPSALLYAWACAEVPADDADEEGVA